MQDYKKFIFRFFYLGLLLFFTYSFIAYIKDPLMLYHKPYFGGIGYDEDLRISAKSVIKNTNFDSVIIGTSMLKNTSSKLANAVIGGEFINITIPSASIDEKILLLNYVFLREQNIKQIVYSLDPNNLIARGKDRIIYKNLYDANELNDFGVYFQPRFVLCVCGLSHSCNKLKDLDLRTFDIDEHTPFGFDNWLKIAKGYKGTDFLFERLKVKEFLPDKYNIKELELNLMKTYIKKEILGFVQKHPNVDFHFIIPPYSKYYYYIRGDLVFAKMREMLKYFISQAQNFPNVKIYGFDNLAYTLNLDNYRDPTHYNIDMNELFLKAIKEEKHLLNTKNIDAYFKALQKDIMNFDIRPYILASKKHFGLD